MIAVLASDCSEELLSAILADAQRSGWKAEASRGSEQTVIAVAGPERLEDLERLLAANGARADADVIELLTRREYRRLFRRRRVMHAIFSGLGVLVALGLGIPVLTFLRPPAEPRSTPESVRAGTVSDLPEGSSRLVRLDDRRVLLVRPRGARLYALDAVCTHMDECGLEWDRERLQIVCACHGCVFDVYGNVVHGPASIPLGSHEVERFGDDLLVQW